MKVLTLHQPWASLVALGVKTIETRSWSTQYRGPLAIHAGSKAKGCAVGDYGFIPAHTVATDTYPGTTYCLWHEQGWQPAPLGAIVATCTLVAVVPMVGHQDAVPERNGFCHVGPGGIWLRGYDSNRDIEDQRPYGDFTPGRFAWLLADIEPVDPPVPFKGGPELTKTWEPEAVNA